MTTTLTHSLGTLTFGDDPSTMATSLTRIDPVVSNCNMTAPTIYDYYNIAQSFVMTGILLSASEENNFRRYFNTLQNQGVDIVFPGRDCSDSGTSTAVGDGFLTDVAQAWSPNEWVGSTLTDITGKFFLITSNTETKLTVYGGTTTGGAYTIKLKVLMMDLNITPLPSSSGYYRYTLQLLSGWFRG